MQTFYKLFSFFLENLNRKIRCIILTVIGFSLGSVSYANDLSQPAYYRYYDKNGVSNISTSVSREHIRYGYEVLDRNMQVIKKNVAYSSEKDQSQSQSRAKKAQQNETDQRLKRAYGSSKVAVNKKNDQLKLINKQITFQTQQLTQLNNDRALFLKQEKNYLDKSQVVPKNLKDRLNYNAQNIANIKQSISTLQSNYRKTEVEYDNIIQRLKHLE